MKTSAKLLVSALLLAGAFAPECAAQDWPNLNCYREANHTLMEARQNDPNDAQTAWVVFMGDSGTQGWTEKDPDFFTDNHFVGRGINCCVSVRMSSISNRKRSSFWAAPTILPATPAPRASR